MRDLFSAADECPCGRMGVIVDNHGRIAFCTCSDGVREREQDTGGYGQFIGRIAGEVVSELQSQLKEKYLAP